MSNDNAITITNVSKSFKLPHERAGSIKDLVINIAKRKKGYDEQIVLKNVSLEIKKGEFFGIVGKNGSGKSTLLKLLAGIYTPNRGSIHVNGSLTPFIELGVGFNPELTGRENVYLNGALLGFTRREMKDMYQDIVNFAELGRFMDQKLKNYSSGMQVRLAFSIAIRAKSDILLIDEVLAVGDAAFQQKCYDMFSKIKELGTTVILVTHDMSAVLRFCERAMLISNGKVEAIGKPSNIADKYLEENYKEQTANSVSNAKNKVSISKIRLNGLEPDKVDGFSVSQELKVQFSSKNNSTDKKIHFGLQIFNDNDYYCFGTNTKLFGISPTTAKNANVKIDINQILVPGRYHINIAVMNESAAKVIAYFPKALFFTVKQESEYEGVALMDHNWKINNV